MLEGSYTLFLLINCVHNWRIKNLVVVCINNYPFFSPYIIHVHICTLRKEDRPLIIVGCGSGGGGSFEDYIFLSSCTCKYRSIFTN